MARRRGFIASIAQVQREAERQRTAQLRAQAQVMRANVAAQREAEQTQRTYERARQTEERESQRTYTESRKATADLQNEELQLTISQLQSVLKDGLSVNCRIDLDELKQQQPIPEFNAGTLAYPEPTPIWGYFCPPEPTGFSKLLPNTRVQHEQATAAAYQRFCAATAAHAARETQRQMELNKAWQAHQWKAHDIRVAMEEQHEEIDRFKRDLNAGVAEAVIDYFYTVFKARAYPEGFPTRIEIDYDYDTKQLIIAKVFPTIEVIPELEAYRYVQVRDEMTEITRPQLQRRALYSSVIAQTILRTLHEIFQTDMWGHVESVVFNCYVTALDKAVGHPTRICIASLTVTREVFLPINLAKVDPVACLARLNAVLSRNLSDAEPVQAATPIRMTAPVTYNSRTLNKFNLMSLTPIEFEQLIAALFQHMGLETQLTKASHDGGIDCIAFDPRPIIGGELIIQAKRYKHTVGVSVVRDLYGAVQDRRASKGILVTTSGYGNDSYKFVANKPLELIDGNKLLLLLYLHMGVEATIVMP